MRKIVLASAAATLVSGAAFAADLPNRRAPPPIYPVAAPIFTWTGFYVGVNAGYAFNAEGFLTTTGNTAVNVANVAAGARPPFVTSRSDGFTGGGQIGYNYQFGAGSGIVVGAEADIAYTDLRRTTSVIGTTGLLNTYRSELNYLGTVRGRLGYSFNQFLVYGTGGFAYGEVGTRANFYNAAAGVAYSGSQSNTRTGYAVGGGVEYAIPTDSYLSFLNFFKSSAVTIKAEYLHYDLGRSNNTFVNTTGAAVGSYSIQNRVRGDLVRVGLNYKF